MSESRRDDDLEATLRDIGRRLDRPRPVAMATRVSARLRAPRPRPRRSFAPAMLALGLCLLVLSFGSPVVRGAAGEFFRLRGIDIFPVPAVPSLAPLGVPVAGERMTLDEARRRARLPVRVPGDPVLGAPDDVFVESSATSDRVTLVYRVRPGVPVSDAAGVSAMVVEVRGLVDESLLGKAAGPGTRIEAVTVNGVRGYWLEGAPHLFFFRDPSGNIRDETLRLAGNTLVWVEDGVTLRLEAGVSRAEAIRIAATFR